MRQLAASEKSSAFISLLFFRFQKNCSWKTAVRRNEIREGVAHRTIPIASHVKWYDFYVNLYRNSQSRFFTTENGIYHSLLISGSSHLLAFDDLMNHSNIINHILTTHNAHDKSAENFSVRRAMVRWWQINLFVKTTNRHTVISVVRSRFGQPRIRLLYGWPCMASPHNLVLPINHRTNETKSKL